MGKIVAGRKFLCAAVGAAAREFPGLRATDRRAAARSAAEYPEQHSGQSRLHASDRPDRQCGGAISASARSRDRGRCAIALARAAKKPLAEGQIGKWQTWVLKWTLSMGPQVPVC